MFNFSEFKFATYVSISLYVQASVVFVFQNNIVLVLILKMGLRSNECFIGMSNIVYEIYL